jgi:NAD+ synthase
MVLPLNITIAQLNPTVGALHGNFGKIRAVRDQNKSADIIVYPEMITTGYPTDDLVLNPYFMDRVEYHIKELAQETTSPALLISTPWRQDGKLFNAALLIAEGKILSVTSKYHLPNYGVFDEKRIFARGPLPEPVDFKGHKLGVMICEDMWFPDVSSHLKKKGAEIFIVPNGSPYQTDIQQQRQAQAAARVKENKIPLVYVNQIGGQDELVFDGGSFLMNDKAERVHTLPLFEECICDSKDTHTQTRLDKNEEVYKAVTVGLKDYVLKNNFPGVLIGLSGGIDSALSAAIAVDALGADKVHCVMMPSPYTSQESLDDAQACANALGVTLDTISIEPAMAAFGDMLEEHTDEKNPGTTFENIQSRARGMILMALSNATGKMVLSTGNKSEMAVGYATLYGDMCGGFNALKDLYKTQVYALSKWRNTVSEVIPENIIAKAPSAELKPDQTDQDTLPPYDILDEILESLIEKDMAPQDIPHDQNTVLKIWEMLDRAEYKRRQAPPGVKITARAFGRNRRYPITNGFFKSSGTST